jgi:thiosulfate/3-mercaptopyruvate sulfurtransferase
VAVTPVSQRGYPNPQLLAETEWLAEHLDDPSVRIIDTRPHQQYEEWHIPGAVSLPAHGTIPRSENGDMGSPEDFARLAGALGVNNDTTVVIYDAPGAPMGAAAWAFLYYGHKDVRILDGGFHKWSNEGRPVSNQVSNYPRTDFDATVTEAIYCSLDSARSSHGSPGTLFWDVRSSAEHEGSAQVGNNPRSGHIPGAIHLEWTELLDPETRTLKPGDELQQLLSSRGITPESEINCY